MDRNLAMPRDAIEKAQTPFRCALVVNVSVALTLASAAAFADPSLRAMNTYSQPPFVPARTDRSSGLASALVEMINQATDGRPFFQLENLPRKRLELTLGGRSFSGVALFLAPEFLISSVQRGDAWSEPVMVDENLIVSTKHLDLQSIDSLHGMKLGGISGHIYHLLGPAFDEGKLLREDAPDHISNLRKLCLGRVDFVVISKSELAGTQSHVSCSASFRPTAFPQPQLIVRRVLVRMPTDADTKFVLDAVARVACSPQWTQALGQYGLSTVGCRNALAKSGGAAGQRKEPATSPKRAAEPS